MDLAQTGIAHHGLRQKVIGIEEPALHAQQTVLRLHGRPAQQLGVVNRQRHRRFKKRPEALLEGHERMLHMIGRTGRDVHDIDVTLVKHVAELTEHLAVREILGDDVTTLLDEIAGGHDLEEARVRLEHGIVFGKHRSAQPHEGDPNRGTLVIRSHFLTISVIADRNCATSVN